MRILVYGAGVIGCNLAADLYRNGKDVTLLARGKWADTIEEKGLRIRLFCSFFEKKYDIPVIRQLEKDDYYDVIFVVMRYTQLNDVVGVLKENISQNIVFTGNNVSCEAYVEKLEGKNVLFAFNMAAGHREEGRVVSVSMKKITIGEYQGTGESEALIRSVFDGTDMKVAYEKNMGDYLLCHAAFVTPIGFACYHCDGDLKKISRDREYLNQIIDANIEGYQAIEDLGHKILPESDQDYHSEKYRRLCYFVYKVLCSTALGKICASDHALNAVGEMSAINQGMKKLFEQAHADHPVWKKLEEDAIRHLEKSGLI